MRVNLDLENERRKTTLNPECITEKIFGKKAMQIRRLAYERAAEDKDFQIAENFATMDRDNVYSEAVRMYTTYSQRLKQYNYKDPITNPFGAQSFFKQAVFIGPVFPFNVHHILFLPTILSQGTDDQIAKFLPLAENLEIIGTYAQTEMGHGTYVKGLETTATFDRDTQHFIIHSPTITSTKFWPAGLGCTCNYAVVMAQLIIDQKPYGMHLFLCQLRDLHDHKPLPGIELGDINSKFGFEIVDNGYLKFNQYRIPRTNMLMRHAQVSKDGTYTSQTIPQIVYLSMMSTRMMIIQGAADDLAMAATIATRYSAVRRQTANSKGVEPQVLDYQTQQMKLFPAISLSYALWFCAHSVRSFCNQVMIDIQGGNDSRLKELHCLTCGMKAFATEMAASYIEMCRRSCGGHGYSHASGIPKLYLQCLPQSTYEGDNTVLYLQCGRSLLKFYMLAQGGAPVPSTMQLLAETGTIPANLQAATDFNLTLYELILKLNTLSLITDTVARLQESSASKNADAAFNAHSLEIVDIAKAYCLYTTLVWFIETLEETEWDYEAKTVMVQVCELYAVHNILVNSGSLLQNKVVTRQQMSRIASRRVELLAELRPNAVTLVDAFDYPDRLLNSCLGRYDGNVYEALYEYAKSSSLNHHQVHSSYEKHIKPMQQALMAKL